MLKIPCTNSMIYLLIYRLLLSLDTIAGRMLSASMLETANQMYPTSQALRRHLASLYGTDMSTNCFRRGRSHIVELTFTYVRDEFLSRKKCANCSGFGTSKRNSFFTRSS